MGVVPLSISPRTSTTVHPWPVRADICKSTIASLELLPTVVRAYPAKPGLAGGEERSSPRATGVAP
jgi:hypothetical protein